MKSLVDIGLGFKGYVDEIVRQLKLFGDNVSSLLELLEESASVVADFRAHPGNVLDEAFIPAMV